jgi:uncharacterized membrane protein YphA (DoxX/SURF4 family)
MVGIVNAHAALAPFAVAIRTLISLVFLTASYGKLRHGTSFQGVVANYRLLPDAMVAPVAYLIPPVELLLSATLLLGLAFPWPELAAAGLLLLFALAMGINLRRGRRHIDCGCFQSALKQTLSGVLVMRNVVLALLMGVVLFTNEVPDDVLTLVSGYLAGGVLFIILHALGILWSISPAWRQTAYGRAGAAS